MIWWTRSITKIITFKLYYLTFRARRERNGARVGILQLYLLTHHYIRLYSRRRIEVNRIYIYAEYVYYMCIRIYLSLCAHVLQTVNRRI